MNREDHRPSHFPCHTRQTRSPLRSRNSQLVRRSEIILVAENPGSIVDADGSLCAEFRVHFYDVLGVAVLLTQVPAGGVGADGKEGKVAAGAVEGSDVRVEGGDVACVAGVEEEGVRRGRRGGAMDYEVAVPETCVCVEGVTC